MKIVIISGLSGSGKTVALQTLEDLQYYCVDNLPVHLLVQFAQELALRNRDVPVAIGVDARCFSDDLTAFPAQVAKLQALDFKVEVVVLQASDEILLQRYSETRRRHPLSQVGRICLTDAILKERNLLQPVFAMASLIIDTSQYNVHQLRKTIQQRLQLQGLRLSLLLESFGFRYGLPADADWVFDIRCLPNPHWVPELRPQTGLDQDVQQFLSKEPEVQKMRTDILRFLQDWIPSFENSSRSYITIAIGCTGGQHRSVFLVESIGAELRTQYPQLILRHRELERKA